jgi:septum formation protein
MDYTYKIVLGSASPRRAQILKEAGFDFSVKTTDKDEVLLENAAPVEQVCHLAKQKAIFIFPDLSNDEILITSDTIVVQNHQILGKPKSIEEAKSFLQAYSGSNHSVITAVCIKNKDSDFVFYEETKVFFNEISVEDMDVYLETNSWKDKAGGYGIQDSFGKKHISSISGCYYNVMGFPMARFYQEFQKWIKEK